jgi:creatinine amidohydrolase
MPVLEEMTSFELRRLIDGGGRVVVVPFGSVEYHGGHLPLGSDALLADAVGAAVAEQLGAVLAPTFRVGCADQHMAGAGTLMISMETLCGVVLAMARSLIGHGFRVIVLVSTHGGNQGVLERAALELSREYRDVVVCAPRGDVGTDAGTHSGRWLTSVMLSLRPDLVEADLAGEGLKAEVPDATPETGAKNLERFVSTIVQQVRGAAQDPPGGAS